ncbi:MAG: hypothetical protein AB9873_18500 [Syntrophobacteraceae bacterium]
MEFTAEDLSKVRDVLLTSCREYEPWADMMFWTGGGDHGVYDFPLDLDQVERIDISFEPAGGPPEAIASAPELV